MTTQPLFISGTGTGVGKTIVAAIITEALEADYWKPVQAGVADGTDAIEVKALISNKHSVIYEEAYKLSVAASPHIAAAKENIRINLETIHGKYLGLPDTGRPLVIEGAGGIMVPLNEHEFVIDLVKMLNAKLILVSKNYLGSINHSMVTAMACSQKDVDTAGWIFNDQYMDYEDEIVEWTDIPKIGSVPFCEIISKPFIKEQAERLRESLLRLL